MLGAEEEHAEYRQVNVVTWFRPTRPVDGTIYVLPQVGPITENGHDGDGRAQQPRR